MKYTAKHLLQAVRILERGGVIAHATETCYGFACDAFNKKALARFYKIKKMSPSKPISIMVSGLTVAKKYGFFSKAAQNLAKKYWPGPLTIIVKRKKSLPHFLNAQSKTIGFRVPAHKLSLALLNFFGSPLTTTSANISGWTSPYSSLAIKRQFRREKDKPDLILDSGRLKKNPPSTIVDMSVNPPIIIRRGACQFSRDLLWTCKA